MVYPAAPADRSPRYKFWLVLFVLAMAVFITLPSYFAGHWAWQRVPELKHLHPLQALQKQGIELPGWQTLKQQQQELGGHKWSIQAIAPASSSPVPSQDTNTPPSLDPTTALTTDPTTELEQTETQAIWLMLRPQIWHRDMPEIDWMDINGVQAWTADSLQSLTFQVATAAKPISVSARFFRGWNQEHTYAVMQWYAWSTGGSPAPMDWFWVDQQSQWRDRQHTPWVAVSLLLPISPLGDIESVRSQAISLGQVVQSTLMQTALHSPA